MVIHLDDKERDFATAALALAGAATGAMALFQRVVVWPALLRQPDLSPEQLGRLQDMRAFGLSLSPDLAGGIGLLGLLAALHIGTKNKQVGVRVFAGLCAALSVSQVIIARSNGTFLAAMLAVFAMAVVSKKKTMRLGALGLAVVVALTAVLSGRLAALPASAGERLANWRVALDIFTHHPGVGVGVGRFAPAYLAARESGDNITRYAHSAPLQALAELGLVGAVFVAMALIAFGILIVARQSAGGAPTFLLGLVVVAMTRPLFDYDLQIGQSAALFAVALALFTPFPKARHDALASRIFPAVCGLWVLALTASAAPVLFQREAALQSQDIGRFPSRVARRRHGASSLAWDRSIRRPQCGLRTHAASLPAGAGLLFRVRAQPRRGDDSTSRARRCSVHALRTKNTPTSSAPRARLKDAESAAR